MKIEANGCTANLYLGDSLEVLDTLDESSVDSLVTDPPYEIGFMGRKWDATGIAFLASFWKKCWRVLKPGGHLLAFGAARGYHRMTCAIEDAGFEIRDSLLWLFGSGFPKALDVSKAIVKSGRAEGERWDGWKTALKPAYEPIVLARKPLDGTVANNTLKHGVGGLHIDACRIGTDVTDTALSVGRFPANVLIDEETAKMIDEQSGVSKSGKNIEEKGTGGIWQPSSGLPCGPQYEDFGGASRFFYTSKAQDEDRNAGLNEFEERRIDNREDSELVGRRNPRNRSNLLRKNTHPTVKPCDLMQYLIRLVTPKGGIVLDPFMGSGSTGKAALLEQCNFIGIEREKEYFELARGRINFLNPF